MSLVLDCSLALAWLHTDEYSQAAAEILDRVADSGAIVPGLWRLEMANALNVAIKRKRISIDQRDRFLHQLERLGILTDEATSANAWDATLALAGRYNLTVYDAAYLELAIRLQLPLATLDKELVSAARQADVSVLP